MVTIQRLIVAVLMVCTFTACSMASEREAHRASALLNEADLLISIRKFDDARELAQEAKAKLEPLLENKPDHLDFRLLHIRAHLTLFMADNTQVIENAPVRPNSLVKFPEPDQFINYNTTIRPAEEELWELANGNADLDNDQRAFVHGSLAMIFRFNEKTLDNAVTEYGRAIEAYQKSLDKLRADTSKVGSHKIQIAQLKNQIRGLHQSTAEVQLLAENWTEALESLEIALAGEDLKYFDVQFGILQERIENAQKKLDSDSKLQEGSREAKLLKLVEAKKSKLYSKQEELSGYNPYRVELIQAQIELADTQNNLTYRIICYRHLERGTDQDEAQAVLARHYPEIEASLDNLFQNAQ